MFKQGDIVITRDFMIRGKIVGMAYMSQWSKDKIYILECLDGYCPSKSYPFTHFVCSEKLIKLKEEKS